MTQGRASGEGRVTVVGEVLVDLLWPAGAAQLTAVPGGSPANVAVGLDRLGRTVTLVTTWGDDHPGEQISGHLAASGVEVVRAASLSGRSTVALAYLDSNNSATYNFLAFWDPRRLEIAPDTSVLHTGSLAIVLEPGASEVLRLCKEVHAGGGPAVVVDLNVRPAVQPDRDAYRAVCMRLAKAADVVKASEEDLAWLFPGLDPVASARVVAAAGPRLVVVTLGSEGALAVTADVEVRVPAPRIAVADTVGAGDSFQAALLDAIASWVKQPRAGGRLSPPATAEEIGAVLTRCVAAAAINCTRTGANPPTAAELATELATGTES